MAKKRKRKLQNGGRVLTAQEKIAQQILSGQRPAQRQSAARRKGRTTSELPSDEVRDRVSNFLPDVRPFERAYAKYQAGENLSTQDKIDLGIETGFAGLAAVPVVGALAQKGKPMIKGLAKKLLGSAPQGRKVKKTKAEKIAAENKAARELAEKNKRSRQTGANRRRANRARKRAADKPDVINAPPPKPQAQLPKPKPIRRPDETSGPTIRAGDRLGGATPAVRKPTTPAATPKPAPKPKTPPKDKGKIVGLSNKGKAAVGGGLAAGTAAYLSQSEKDAKPAAGSQATKNKAPYVEGYNMDMDDFDSPKPSYPKPPKQDKPAEDEFYKFYGKEGTGLGDFSRKFGIKYATQKGFERDFPEHDGEKRGGRPGKGKMKTQGLNRSKRSGFSGRGTGAALRGF